MVALIIGAQYLQKATGLLHKVLANQPVRFQFRNLILIPTSFEIQTKMQLSLSPLPENRYLQHKLLRAYSGGIIIFFRVKKNSHIMPHIASRRLE